MSVNNYELMKELGRQRQQKLLTEAANERRVRNARAQQRPGRLRGAILGTPLRKLPLPSWQSCWRWWLLLRSFPNRAQHLISGTLAWWHSK